MACNRAKNKVHKSREETRRGWQRKVVEVRVGEAVCCIVTLADRDRPAECLLGHKQMQTKDKTLKKKINRPKQQQQKQLQQQQQQQMSAKARNLLKL